MDLSEPVLFWDTSYFVFYRYYAVMGWFKKAMQRDVDIANITSDTEFMSKYDHTFERTIVDLSKRYKVPFHNMVFAKDCTRDNIWRTAIYPEYKATRDDRLSSFNRDIFKYTYNVLIPRLQKQYAFVDVFHNHLEADDIIACFVSKLRELNKHVKMIIITNDNDYIQLNSKNVQIINLQHKALIDRIDDPETYLAYKIIIGDKSDNIRPIAKKVGEKTAKKMLQDVAVFEKIMTQQEVQQNHRLNTTLIDFNSIPRVYVDEMHKCLKKLILS